MRIPISGFASLILETNRVLRAVLGTGQTAHTADPEFRFSVLDLDIIHRTNQSADAAFNTTVLNPKIFSYSGTNGVLARFMHHAEQNLIK